MPGKNTDISTVKHDFTNNCLRIEILQKLMLEDLDNGGALDPEQTRDYERFLDEQKTFLKSLPLKPRSGI